MINSVVNSGLNGINVGLKGIANAAQDIAGLNVADVPDRETEPGNRRAADVQDTVRPLVDLKLYKHQVEASAKVIATADSVLGFLIDETV